MSVLTLHPSALGRGPVWRRLASELALGFGYWAVFLIALEPGNLIRAANGGHPLALEAEAVRMLAASLLGAATAPLILAAARWLPIEGPGWRRRAAIHAAGVAGLVGVLIPLSCLLASLSVAQRRIGGTDLAGQFAGNGLLLVFSFSGFWGLAHALHFRGRSGGRAAPAAAPSYLAQVPVKARGGLVLVGLDQVDWIETQGNYLALHVGGATHLIRETSARLEAKLDPDRFQRIHRRVLVAVDRVRELRPIGGGDAELRLADGTRLRLSRSFRERVQARLEGSRA
jgi:hypothetical protein